MVTNLTTEQFDKLREDSVNASVGSLDGADCDICHNKGYVASVVNGSLQTRECVCMAKRRGLKRIKDSGLSDRMAECTFKAYETPEPWQVDAKAKAESYAADSKGKWFLASGSVGSGKTHLCTAICGELLEHGKSVRYMRWRDDSVRLKSSVNDDGYESLIAPYQKCQALYIDDLFKGGATDADKKLAFQILDYRYGNRNLATIISTEKTPEELLVIDEAVGSRIWARSKESCVVVSGKHNWRLK